MLGPRPRRSAFVGTFLASLALLSSGMSVAQEAPVMISGPDGQLMTPEQMQAMVEARRGAQGPQTPSQPPQEAKPGEGEKKLEGEGEKKKDEAGDSVKRSDKPPRDPDPREFDVALDEQGRVPPFNFVGQPWPDVMQWFANLAKASLDWQELPSGYLNLTTQRSYTLDELRDLINRHLHARGYTSIQSGEIISVFRIDKLDPSLVRRVAEDQLYDLRPYDFVKACFELPEGMEVEKAKDDVKQLLSPSAKVFPLVTTRQLLIMDAVANLRTVSELLNEERMVQDGRIMPREFVLKYARPEQVIETLYVVLGIDPKAKPAQTDPQQLQQMQQMMQQAQQRGQDIMKLLPKSDAPKVYLAFNRRRNSVLANAPPREMKIIEQTISYLDVPHGASGLAMSDSTDNAERTLVRYQLVTMDPEQLRLTLEEIGELDPRTELRADPKAKILFARATAADHKKIAALKDELDGTGRKLHVKWLPRHLPADAVAGTIYALMGGQGQEEEEPGYPYYYFSYRRRSNNDQPKKGFRVDADIENNRLLLWANDAEVREVEHFLAELSKASPSADAQRAVRTTEPMTPEAAARLLEQLRRAWPALGENELIINDARQPSGTTPKNEKHEQESEAKDREARVPGFLRLPGARADVLSTGVRFVEFAAKAGELTKDNAGPDATSSETSNEERSRRRPPVTVSITEDGRLLIASEDTEALDRLEQFLGQAAAPTQRYKIFRIKYADVFDVYLNLKEFYEDELKGDTKQVWNWWWDMYQNVESDQGRLLSKRPTLRLIWDPASNSILVANASAKQLAEIEQLIKEYDQPTPDDSTTERITRPIKIHYSRASTIVAAVKEVYRDLLSSKDKEFDSKEQKGGTSSGGITVLRYSPFASSDEGTKRSAPVKVGFQGALSLGADDVSNIVLVSAQKEVFDGVEAMIRQLDAEAAPKTTVQVHRLNGNVTAAALQKALDEAVGKAWLGNRPEQTGTSGEDERPQGRDRNRDRGDQRRNRTGGDNE